MCVSMPNFVKIDQTAAEKSRFNIYRGRPPSGIRWARIWTTHDEYLVISIIEQHLVAVVLIICDFQCFAR